MGGHWAYVGPPAKGADGGPDRTFGPTGEDRFVRTAWCGNALSFAMCGPGLAGIPVAGAGATGAHGGTTSIGGGNAAVRVV